MKRYSQKRASFRRIFEAVAVNHTGPLHANPLRAPLAFLQSWSLMAVFAMMSCCPMMSIWAMLLGDLDASMLAHLLCCALVYVAWSLRARRRLCLATDGAASLAHACLARLAPYVDENREGRLASWRDLIEVTVPLLHEQRADLTISRDLEDGRWSLELVFGAWSAQEARAEPCEPGAAPSDQMTAECDDVAALTAAFADFVSRCALKVGLRAQAPAFDDRPAVFRLNRTCAAMGHVEAPRRAALAGWEPPEAMLTPPWWRHPWVHIGVYWLLGAWPLCLFVRALMKVPWQEFGAMEEYGVLSLIIGLSLLGGFLSWHPPTRVRSWGHDQGDIHELMWDGRALADSISGHRVVVARPFSLEVTREPVAAGGVVILNLTLTQRAEPDGAGQASFQRLRFSVPVADEPALAVIPTMVLRAPRVRVEDYEAWLEPLLAFGAR